MRLRRPVVILGVPWTRVRDVLTPDIAWDARVLIDATDIFTRYASHFEVDQLGGRSGSESVARVVKAFNTLPIDVMFAPARVEGLRRLLFVAGNQCSKFYEN